MVSGVNREAVHVGFLKKTKISKSEFIDIISRMRECKSYGSKVGFYLYDESV